MAWNVFKFCTALRGLGSIMILLVLGIVGVTYYAVVWTNYGPALSVGGLDSLAALVVILLFHFLVNPFHRFLESFVLLLKKLIIMMCVCVCVVKLGMLLWSYFSAVFTDPGVVPASDEEEQEGECDPLNSLEFGGLQPDASNQRTRFCRKCNQHKPPRCHHCSVCKLSLGHTFCFMLLYFNSGR